MRERYALAAPVETLLKDYYRLTWEHMPRLAPDVVARLEALRAGGWKVAIVTNGEADAQAATIERIGAAELVDAVVVSGAVGIRKPDPRSWIAAEECGVALSGAWLVGDGRPTSARRSRRAHLGVAVAGPRRGARDLVPDHVAPTLLEALALVS